MFYDRQSRFKKMSTASAMSTLNEVLFIQDAANLTEDDNDFKFSSSTPIADGQHNENSDKDDSINDEDEDVPSSLVEFEENEKKAAAENSSIIASRNTSTATATPTSAGASNKLDDVISELRECFEVDSGNEEAPWLPLKSDSSSVDAESRYHSELVRRVQCERQIEELNRSLCELSQQVALAGEFEKKRKRFARKIDSNLNQV